MCNLSGYIEKKINKLADKYRYVSKEQKILQKRQLELNHPERLAALPYCEYGRGIDVGCGHRKTSERCIGVDIVPKGEKGSAGCVKGKESAADICTSGDDLHMFKDNALDFVIARHNLEHYVDVVKTLQEWKRVLKFGGSLVLILPDEDGLNEIGRRGINLDPTHEHSFTQASIKNLLQLIGGLEVIRLEEVVKNWSFICVCKRV